MGPRPLALPRAARGCPRPPGAARPARDRLRTTLGPVSLLSVVLLVLAALAVVGAEWPRIARALGAEGGGSARRRPAGGSVRGSGRGRGEGRGARRAHLRVVPDERPAATTDADDFVASVRRDLDRLPTFERDKDS